jgi:hypothetical protein
MLDAGPPASHNNAQETWFGPCPGIVAGEQDRRTSKLVNLSQALESTIGGR